MTLPLEFSCIRPCRVVWCWLEKALCRSYGTVFYVYVGLRVFSIDLIEPYIGLRNPRLVALCRPEMTLYRSEGTFSAITALHWSKRVLRLP